MVTDAAKTQEQVDAELASVSAGAEVDKATAAASQAAASLKDINLKVGLTGWQGTLSKLKSASMSAAKASSSATAAAHALDDDAVGLRGKVEALLAQHVGQLERLRAKLHVAIEASKKDEAAAAKEAAEAIAAHSGLIRTASADRRQLHDNTEEAQLRKEEAAAEVALFTSVIQTIRETAFATAKTALADAMQHATQLEGAAHEQDVAACELRRAVTSAAALVSEEAVLVAELKRPLALTSLDKEEEETVFGPGDRADLLGGAALLLLWLLLSVACPLACASHAPVQSEQAVMMVACVLYNLAAIAIFACTGRTVHQCRQHAVVQRSQAGQGTIAAARRELGSTTTTAQRQLSKETKSEAEVIISTQNVLTLVAGASTFVRELEESVSDACIARDAFKRRLDAHRPQCGLREDTLDAVTANIRTLQVRHCCCLSF